ncbi:double-stranded RNA-binding protein Staufen homolog 2 isoform X1 [Nasonia vitripennis]|uniref:DRBM domain-containing protein n=1 Tax=Nasonia vitripennis TaxID=7425 RepID=A0A7M7QEL7_NASVI|nr:double-stranded RNA-binding protein Staufen homolog 2 isoform X1 [Nasonia vitripennis]XP_031786215.1 double-stranded RNA-binding protein Staufen homolog 2 isoform X1 [Nasonia vitripennis]
MRPMQQASMAPTHQPVQHPHAHSHHHHQQLLTMAHQQHFRHMQQQHPMTMSTPRMLMGMNSPNPNESRHILTVVILACLLLSCDAKVHRPSLLDSIDSLELFFGPSGCIEGTLALVNVGLKDQANAMPMTLQNPNHHSLQQQQQQNIEQKKNATEDTGESKDDGSGSQQQGQANSTNANLANTREKTPMCLVNELARFNKIQHQYRLTNEQGPAHKKRFTVTLMLGEEEYVAEGPSIKKAQHSAASDALTKTWYRKPPPKPTRAMRIPGKCPAGSGGHLPPTVELNALAMKRGEPTVYTFRHAPPAAATAPQQFVAHGYSNFPRMFNPRYPAYNRGFNPEPQGIYLVTLKVGEREFIGRGVTGQAARHDAASRALEQLRQLPLPEELASSTITTENGAGNGTGAGIDDPNAELKSPVSLVHETALKRGLSVSFDVVSETGKPHIRTFMTRCTVGDKVTLGEGSSKKVSKKRAAELMLEELKRLPLVAAPIQNRTLRLKRKPPATKKKSRNLIKVYQEPRTEADSSEEVNPISRLVQIQQAKREREPVYNLVEEKGAPRRREFVMEVSVGQHSAQGTGPNKKLAKRAAAEALLATLGYSKPQPQPAKPSIKTSSSGIGGGNGAENKEGVGEGKRKVTFVEVDTSNETTHTHPQGGSIGRQLVPGLLLVDNGTDSKVISGPSVQVVAEELRGQQPPQSTGVSPKDQLKYLAQLLNFEVQFSDFPKGTYKEYLSLVSLSTDPPQVCHGHGPTKSASRDQAALTALRTLSKLGLDSVTNSGAKKDKSSANANDAGSMHVYGQQVKTNNVINGAMDK